MERRGFLRSLGILVISAAIPDNYLTQELAKVPCEPVSWQMHSWTVCSETYQFNYSNPQTRVKKQAKGAYAAHPITKPISKKVCKIRLPQKKC